LATALARYELRFAQLMPTDPRVRFIERFPSRPLSCRMELGEAESRSSRMYRDILRPAGVEYSLVVKFPRTTARSVRRLPRAGAAFHPAAIPFGICAPARRPARVTIARTVTPVGVVPASISLRRPSSAIASRCKAWRDFRLRFARGQRARRRRTAPF
jgi:hypothetical protein